MDCKKIRIIIPRYVKHSATDEEIGMVEEHLCVCHDCRQYLSDFLNKEDTDDRKDTDSVKTSSVYKDADTKKPDILTISIIGIGIIASFISVWFFLKTH